MLDTSQKGDGEGWRNETLVTSETVIGPREGDGAVYKPYSIVPWDIEEQDWCATKEMRCGWSGQGCIISLVRGPGGVSGAPLEKG